MSGRKEDTDDKAAVRGEVVARWVRWAGEGVSEGVWRRDRLRDWPRGVASPSWVGM